MSNHNSHQYTENINNTHDHRWLDLIVNGHLKKNGHNVYKTMIGRINDGKWKDIQAGDELLLNEVEGNKWVLCRVVAKHQAPNFSDLAKNYGRYLAPHLSGNIDQIEIVHRDMIDQNLTDSQIDEIIEKNGVVAIEIKKLQYSGFYF